MEPLAADVALPADGNGGAAWADARDGRDVRDGRAVPRLPQRLPVDAGDGAARVWDGFWAQVFSKFHAFFTDEGRDKWCAAAKAAAMERAQAHGRTADEVRAACGSHA